MDIYKLLMLQGASTCAMYLGLRYGGSLGRKAHRAYLRAKLQDIASEANIDDEHVRIHLLAQQAFEDLGVKTNVVVEILDEHNGDDTLGVDYLNFNNRGLKSFSTALISASKKFVQDKEDEVIYAAMAHEAVHVKRHFRTIGREQRAFLITTGTILNSELAISCFANGYVTSFSLAVGLAYLYYLDDALKLSLGYLCKRDEFQADLESARVCGSARGLIKLFRAEEPHEAPQGFLVNEAKELAEKAQAGDNTEQFLESQEAHQQKISLAAPRILKQLRPIMSHERFLKSVEWYARKTHTHPTFKQRIAALEPYQDQTPLLHTSKAYEIYRTYEKQKNSI